MKPHAVSLPVITAVPIECEFWPEDDGWKGTCKDLGVSVHGDNFEQAKKNMEEALKEYISTVLRERGARIAA